MPEQIISALIPGFVISVLTAYLTVRLSLWRFRSEKWWERKTGAYSDIMEALHKVQYHASNFIDGIAVHGEDSAQRSLEGRREVDRIIAVNSLLISDEAMNHLRTFRRKSRRLMLRSVIQEGDVEDTYATTRNLDYAKRELGAVEVCIQAVQIAARKDLRLDSYAALLARLLHRSNR